MRKPKKHTIFYDEYMDKRWPIPPRSVCKNEIDRRLGIVSPSLYFDKIIGAKGESVAQELDAYNWCLLRYLCYKRRITKNQWKRLYGHTRKANRDHGCGNLTE